MDKAIAEARTAFLAAGTALVIGMATIAASSQQPHITEMLWWRGLLASGLFGMLVGFYGFLSLVFPAIGPTPQMLQDALLWNAKRYRDFAKRHQHTKGDVLGSLFWEKYPFDSLHHLVTRASNVVGASSVRINWQLLTSPPSSCQVILGIADHIELIAQHVPSNVPI